MATEKEVVKTIAEAIAKAARTITEQNNKSYVDNKLKNFTGGSSGSGSGGGGSISGQIPASQVTGLYNTVAGYIVNAQTGSAGGDPIAARIVGALNDLSNAQIAVANFDASQILNLKVALEGIIALAKQVDPEDGTIRDLRADIAEIGLADIGTAEIGYAQVKDLQTDTAIFREAGGSKLYIDRLSVIDANMVSLTAGELMLKNSAGQFVRIVIDSQGNVSGQPVTFDGDDVFNDNSLTASKIVENSITARELNVSSIFADEATIGAIKAQNIDVADLFANTAFVNSLYTSTIQAPTAGTDIDISSNSQITLLKNRIALLVEDGSSSTEIILTPGMLEAITDHVNVIADTIDLSANTSIDARVIAVVDEEIGYHMDMLSTSDILSDSITSTTLSVTLYKGKDDVTNSTSALKFDWKRKSSNSTADTTWNNSHKGMKSITVGRSDVDYSATFECVYTDTDTVLATASKGILDRSDGKVLSVSLGYNLPPTQIVDVNTDECSPDWSDMAMVITPVVSEDDEQILLSDNNLSIVWKRRAGAGEETNLVTGETVTNKVLTVSENVLSDITSGLVTYIAHITYTHSDGVSSTAKGESTFSQIKSGRDASLREVRIEGEQVFKYSATSTIPSPESIRLEAFATGCTIAGWQYKTSNGQWNDYPSNLDNTTASINERYIHDTDPVFVDNVATVRVTTNYNDVYDVFSLYKVYDGARGDKGDQGTGDPAPTVFMTNENITFSGNKLGVVSPTSINCNVIAYIGTQKVMPTIGTVSGAVEGMTITTATDTSKNEVSVIISIGSGATLGGEGQQFGAITVPITYPVETNLSITWSKVNTGADGSAGEAAVTFVSYTPNGNVFLNNNGSLLIQTVAYDGSEEINTQDASYSWARFVSGNWTTISGEVTESLTVSGSNVDGVATYRCTMIYKGKTYYTTATLTDKTDNFQVDVESSGGNIFKNTQGSTTLKARLFQNAAELDATGARYTYWWYKLDEDGDPENWNQYDAYGNIVGDGVGRRSGKSILVIDKDVSNKNTFVCEVVDQSISADRVIASGQFTIVDMSDPVQSGTEPVNPVVDMLWIDTSVTPNQLKRWNGSAWVSVSDVDSAALDRKITTLESEISEQGGQILLMATKQEVEQIDDRVTSTETQIAEINVEYDNLTLAVYKKATNYRQSTQPENANPGDIWVQPLGNGTEKTYQAIGGSANIPDFAYDDEGNLIYQSEDEEENTYNVAIDENGYLSIYGDGWYEIIDGELVGHTGWKEIKADSVAALELRVDGITSIVQDPDGKLSVVEQKADKIDWIIANGESASEMELTDEALNVIANNINLTANETVRITSGDQITAKAASEIDLGANDTIRITSGDQITAAAAKSIDLSGNDSISLMTENLSFRIDEMSDVTNKVNRWMTFSDDGLRQGKEGSTYSTLVDDTGFHILQKNEKITTIAKRQIAAEEYRVGKVNTNQTRCVIREAGDNGLIITVEGLA